MCEYDEPDYGGDDEVGGGVEFPHRRSLPFFTRRLRPRQTLGKNHLVPFFRSFLRPLPTFFANLANRPQSFPMSLVYRPRSFCATQAAGFPTPSGKALKNASATHSPIQIPTGTTRRGPNATKRRRTMCVMITTTFVMKMSMLVAPKAFFRRKRGGFSGSQNMKL